MRQNVDRMRYNLHSQFRVRAPPLSCAHPRRDALSYSHLFSSGHGTPGKRERTALSSESYLYKNDHHACEPCSTRPQCSPSYIRRPEQVSAFRHPQSFSPLRRGCRSVRQEGDFHRPSHLPHGHPQSTPLCLCTLCGNQGFLPLLSAIP